MKPVIKIGAALAIIAALAFFGYNRVQKWHQADLGELREQSRKECLTKTLLLEQEIARLQEALEQVQPMPEPALQSRIETALGDNFQVAAPLDEDLNCEEIERQTYFFFSYLDDQPYMGRQRPRQSSFDQFQQMVRDLAAAPPILSGEMEDLGSLIQNVAHLYRILGKKRLQLLQTAITKETDIIEPVMSVVFRWLLHCGQPQEAFRDLEPVEALYNYAGFFLNTLGGRSYLLRQDSRLRVMTTYYCVIVLDLANDAQHNKYGIDIRPYIDLALYDITASPQLIFRNNYLARLTELKQKYAP
jgi:hypothetical protein